METDKSFILQKQVKDNSEDLQSEFLDMKNWEEQMRRKDEELRKEASGEPVLPPIRVKNVKKVQKTVSKENENTTKTKRIKSYDYNSWDKFDVDKACKEIDKEQQSDDPEEEVSSKEELEKAHEKATVHKQEGNVLVQQKKWDKAVGCYSEAIKLFPYDAVFYANRALCQLKLDNLYSAEADCTTAVQLDESYVKAYHRRATARMGLKQYKEAKQDLEKALKLEPSNKEAKSLLAEVEKKIETSKPAIIPKEDIAADSTIEKKIGEKMWAGTKNSTEPKVDKKVEKTVNEDSIVKEKGRDPRIPDWLPEKDDVAIIEPIIKPAHLRSKKPLTRIPVEEVNFDTMHRNNCIDRMPINKSEEEKAPNIVTVDIPSATNGLLKPSQSSESIYEIPSVPKTAVQFLMDWRKNKSPEFRYKYIKQLPKGSLSKVFQDSLESNILSEILEILRIEFIKREDAIFPYLKDLSQVKRFRALIMFFNNSEKQDLRTLFEHCATNEKISEEEVTHLRAKYEV